jgi:hypothetical protein
VKIGEDIIKKFTALSILALYLLMVSTYILYLPKYNGQRSKISAATSAAFLHRSNNANNNFVQLHGAFKSVPENKRKTINLLIKTASLVFLLIFSGAALPGLIKGSGASLKTFFSLHQHNYLGLCTLRI